MNASTAGQQEAKRVITNANINISYQRLCGLTKQKPNQSIHAKTVTRQVNGTEEGELFSRCMCVCHSKSIYVVFSFHFQKTNFYTDET